jgi:hypothetical protein
MWYVYTMEFYSATKKNENFSFASKWIELENIILSEVSQAQKAKNHMFSLMCVLYSPPKKAIILLDMGHTLKGLASSEEVW